MPFYVYVPNGSDGEGGYVSNAFDVRHDAECERALYGVNTRIIEASRPSYKHIIRFRDLGWKKCEACGRATPPWRPYGAGPKPVTQSGSGK
jgi:hypothetical protein